MQLSIDTSFFSAGSIRISGWTSPVETAVKSVGLSGSSNTSVATSFIEKLAMSCRKGEFSWVRLRRWT